jgi:hypothetical protein
MSLTISGMTSLDRSELEAELEPYGAVFTEDEDTQQGAGDMGLFTLGVPLTIAATKIIKAWLKSRESKTVLKVKAGDKSIEITTNDAAQAKEIWEMVHERPA